MKTVRYRLNVLWSTDLILEHIFIESIWNISTSVLREHLRHISGALQASQATSRIGEEPTTRAVRTCWYLVTLKLQGMIE